MIDEQEATLEAQNEAISKSGRPKSTFKESVHEQYVTLLLPAGRGENLKDMRIAKLMDDGGGVRCKDLGECFAGQAQVFGDRGKCFLQGGVSVRKCFQWCEREA